MVWGHRRTRRSTNQLTARLLCLRPQWTQQWASCRPSPPLWQLVQTPAPIYTKNPPTPRCLRTLPKSENARVVAKGSTPSLSLAQGPRPRPQRNTPRPQSPLCSMAVPPTHSPRRSHWRCVRQTGWRWNLSCHRRRRRQRVFLMLRTRLRVPRRRRIETRRRTQSRPRRKYSSSKAENRCLLSGKKWRWKVRLFGFQHSSSGDTHSILRGIRRTQLRQLHFFWNGWNIGAWNLPQCSFKVKKSPKTL